MQNHRRTPFLLSVFSLFVVGLAASSVEARVFDFDGSIEFCDPLACSLAEIEVGDRLAGFLIADDAASAPDSTFDETDVQDYLIVVFDADTGLELIRVGPADGASLVGASLATGSDGELSSGFADFFGEFDGGIFGVIPLDVSIDVTTASFSVATTFLGLGEVSNGPMTFDQEPDADNVPSILDNCSAVANADQRDADEDGYGSICDADFNQDCSVNFLDLGEFKAAFLSNDPNTDMNGDDSTNFLDLGLVKASFLLPPGPSGIANTCSP